MANPTEDLWPVALTATAEDPAPVVLLRQQAELLPGKTDGHVEGVVSYGAVGGTDYYNLYLRSPALGDYMYKILYIALPLTWNQATPFSLAAKDSFSENEVQITDEHHFKEWLRQVFSSEPVIAVVNNMRRRAERRDPLKATEGN